MKLDGVIKGKNMAVGELDSIFRKYNSTNDGFDNTKQLANIVYSNSSLVDETNWEVLYNILVIVLAIKLEEELHHASRIPFDMTIVEFLNLYQEDLLEVKEWFMENGL